MFILEWLQLYKFFVTYLSVFIFNSLINVNIYLETFPYVGMFYLKKYTIKFILKIIAEYTTAKNLAELSL